MRLADLKRVAVRKQARIRFAVPGGLECVVDEHGIARVPGLAQVPAFNLEELAQSAGAFTFEPVAGAVRPSAGRPASGGGEAPRRVTPEQLAGMAGGAEQPHADEHDD